MNDVGVITVRFKGKFVRVNVESGTNYEEISGCHTVTNFGWTENHWELSHGPFKFVEYNNNLNVRAAMGTLNLAANRGRVVRIVGS